MGEYEERWFWVDDPPKTIMESEVGSIFATISGCNTIYPVNIVMKEDEFGGKYWDVK